VQLCRQNPVQTPEPYSAELFTDYLGEEKVEIKSKTKITGKGGSSTSTVGHN
jgi:hypothetical protein